MSDAIGKTLRLHQALWTYDTWYRYAWLAWPTALSLAAAALIFGGNSGEPVGAKWAKPVNGAQSASAGTNAPPNNDGQAQSAATTADQDSCTKTSGDQAIANCTRLIDTLPKTDPWVYNAFYSRGVARGNKAQWQDAIADMTECIARYPAAAGAMNYSGYAHVQRAEYDAAVKDFEAAIKVQPRWAIPHANLADILRIRSKLDAALAKANEAITYEDKNAYGYLVRTRIREEQGTWQECIADASTAINIAPDYAEAYAIRGRCQLELNQNQTALTDLEEALRRGDTIAPVYNNKGVILNRLGNADAALNSFTEALKVDPKSVFALVERGWVFFQKGLYNDAWTDGNAAVQLDQKHYRARLLRARSTMALGQHKNALPDLDVAIGLAPKDGYTRYLKGEAYLFAEMAIIEPCRKTGMPTFNTSELTEGGNSDERKCKEGPDYAGAIELFDQALALDPKIVGAYVNRASANMSLGRPREAEQDLKRAQAIDPNNADVKQLLKRLRG